MAVLACLELSTWSYKLPYGTIFPLFVKEPQSAIANRLTRIKFIYIQSIYEKAFAKDFGLQH